MRGAADGETEEVECGPAQRCGRVAIHGEPILALGHVDCSPRIFPRIVLTLAKTIVQSLLPMTGRAARTFFTNRLLKARVSTSFSVSAIWRRRSSAGSRASSIPQCPLPVAARCAGGWPGSGSGTQTTCSPTPEP